MIKEIEVGHTVEAFVNDKLITGKVFHKGFDVLTIRTENVRIRIEITPKTKIRRV
jgi:hypothetical protein